MGGLDGSVDVLAGLACGCASSFGLEMLEGVLWVDSMVELRTGNREMNILEVLLGCGG